jgi:NAD(P)-dependent dehydrogenase (short-subunit alcohol dehydrogenase family)
MQWNGRAALVTGAASRISRAVARALVARGAKVALVLGACQQAAEVARHTDQQRVRA